MTIPPGMPVTSYANAVLVPGLMDIHIHSAAGHDVMEAMPGALTEIKRFLAAHGVTNYWPTTITAPVDLTLSALDRLAGWIGTAAAKTERARSKILLKPAPIRLSRFESNLLHWLPLCRQAANRQRPRFSRSP